MTHKWTRGLSWLALVLALGATIFAFTGMTLARVDRIGKLEGFSYLYQSAPVAAGALGLAIIALILNWRAGWPARRAALTLPRRALHGMRAVMVSAAAVSAAPLTIACAVQGRWCWL